MSVKYQKLTKDRILTDESELVNAAPGVFYGKNICWEGEQDYHRLIWQNIMGLLGVNAHLSNNIDSSAHYIILQDESMDVVHDNRDNEVLENWDIKMRPKLEKSPYDKVKVVRLSKVLEYINRTRSGDRTMHKYLSYLDGVHID
jgi:hypothetical protein